MLNFYRRWRAMWNPDMYHGWGKTRRYFEGWYVKVVDAREEHAMAIIPGMAFEADGASHAFIQVLDGVRCTSKYIEFEPTDFQPSPHDFALTLGQNFFSATRVRLALPGLSGELHFSGLEPWPKMLGAPGIMGWYSFVPFMECYHGIVSLDHQINGRLQVLGEEVDFSGGKGYMEKDWGQSFPHSWFWMQTNHFDAEGQVSLTASVAKIPWLGSHFIGYIVGFLYGGRLYRFATYTGASMLADIQGQEVQLAFRDRRYRIVITAHKVEGGELISPILGEMRGKVVESMQSTVHVEFYDRENLVFSGTGRNAGLEVAGPVQELLTRKWRR
ncbi:MAG: hypothetical protein IPN33_10055 [Saprospiraceae bacterium]|nr:hypothetical protein [Saprospiraceae bacterium]